MTELDIMKHARGYMDKLSRGVDPISGGPLPGDTTLNNIRLQKCFAYVSEVLGKVIANGGHVGQHERTAEFRLPPERKNGIILSAEPVRLTWLVNAMMEAAADPDMKRPSNKKISDWLLENGFLYLSQGQEGKPQRLPTDKGFRLGLSVRKGQGRDGEYLAVYYSELAQRYVLDHLEQILDK